MRSKKTLLALIGLALLLSLACAKIPFVTTQARTGKTGTTAFNGINQQNSIVQQLPKYESQLFFIELNMATYNRTNTCDVIYTLYKNNEAVYCHTVNAGELQDNSWYTLPDINLDVNLNDNLFLLVSSENTGSNNIITAWMDTDAKEYRCYSYNVETGQAQLYDGSLLLRVNSRQALIQVLNRYIEAPIPLVFIILFIFFFLLLLVLLILLKKEEPNHETHHPNTLLQRRGDAGDHVS